MAAAKKSNPFKAGFGVNPPYLAGRRTEIGVIEETLDEIKDGSGQMNHSPSPALVLSGPRGVGKTVLLTRAMREAGARGIHTAKINCRLLSGPQEKLVKKMFPSGALKKIFGNLNSISFKFMEAGVSIGLREAEADFASAVQVFLSRKPLLLVLDEAHTCKPDSLNLLFDVVQDCMAADMPLALIIAGTPGLRPLLQRCEATYVERSEFLKFNTLSHDEAREALENPARERGRPIDPDALDLLLDWANNYPFFVQLAGVWAWDASKERGGGAITIEDARKGLAEADQKWVDFYKERFSELDNLDLVDCAAQSIGVLRKSKGSDITAYDLRKRLMEMNEGLDDQVSKKKVDDLLEVGFLWEEGDQLAPGIPSMFDYIERRVVLHKQSG